LLKPADFLSRAAHSWQALRIGEWVIHAACAQAQQWHQAENPFTLPIAVNVDVSLLQPEFFKTIAKSLAHHCVQPSRLQLEVTESMLVRDVTKIAAVLDEVSEGGVDITIDGFGAGFSSIAALKTLPISVLKIDPCFLRDTDDTSKECGKSSLAVFPNDTSLVLAMLSMARALGLRVVADGVETEEQFEALKVLGCHEYQGTYFSEPLEADALIERLQREDIVA
jgi:EAL domain-containing protein (putative c-di-GMP-specific phosphodiesterase class I)